MGLTEWHDLRRRLATRCPRSAALVLVGYSMGGAIVAQFMERSPLAPRVAGLVLDAPALDWRRILEFNATEMGLPGFAALRSSGRSAPASTPTGAASTRSAPGDFHLPILLFHGTEDKIVPIATSDDSPPSSPVGSPTTVPPPGTSSPGTWLRGGMNGGSGSSWRERRGELTQIAVCVCERFHGA